MNEAYGPYENASAECINGILKPEFLINTRTLNINTMQLLVKNSVKLYDIKRPHYSCNYLTPW